MRRKVYYVLIICAGCILYAVYSCNRFSSNQNIAEEIPDTVSYNFNIRPILSDKCFKCHGPDANKRQAGLRLDMPESAFGALKDDPDAHALVPGSLKLSHLSQRITTDASTTMMPPPGSNLKRLNPFEVELIKKWIKQGAKYEKHWAFVSSKSYPVPEVEDKACPKNPIDNFILHKLEAKEITPNPEADKERLLNRICFDLNGLPPDLAT